MAGLFGSPLFSPSKKPKTKISPIRAVTTGQVWEPHDKDDDDDDGQEEEERLSRELDDALEELDVPSSSLPIASSDFDAEPPATSSSSGGHEEDQDEDETMRYWSTGLPPSSPPPPTSPVLQSQTDDEEMEDIANAMSDSDSLAFEPQQQQQQEFPSTSGTSSDYLSSDPMLSSDDIAMCFDDFNQLFSDPMMMMMHTGSEDDVSSSLLPVPSSDPVVQNGIADFDFTQFWESVKPLVDQSMADADGTQADSRGGEIDHVKLAEEVHALFSGCLM